MGDASLHVAIILDGNRRYAKKKGLPDWEGHRFGAEKVKQLLRWCGELPVRELTLYTFSIENFKRSKIEKEVLFQMFRESIESFLEKRAELEKKFEPFNIHFIGRLEMFPSDMRESMRKVMNENKPGRRTLNLAMAYGGRQEIVDAVKKMVKDKIPMAGVNENSISQRLWIPSEPDLIIRPGGEQRMSNFLLWQGSYAEWYFTDKLWPEFTKKDLENAIAEYRKRERRFGS
ncbi:MAG: polyprenyl diphosphate synthase [Nanoarchaeota archaeon]|nr:polyprenyl diphosphate synthase [Nanoarchaeota archaeon]